MYFEKSLGIFMGAFVVWGFLMALFFNLMLKAYKAKNDPKLLWCSFVMAVSYVTSDHFFDFFSTIETYFTWFVYDIVTLLAILPVFLIKRTTSVSPGVIYVTIGLVINSILFLGMHVDLVYLNVDSQPWWFWSFYSITVNLCDLAMIVALIVDKDILGILLIKRTLKKQLLNFQPSSWFGNKCCHIEAS
ncbi:hypothetical protein MHM93_04320 [Pseudoalteromonas sp. MM17-2]|uniref:hypothetical protein n=1 Tax=Pseudoalteromonas sp. MM17-2 TaxID=2917753 RepID=UPI001EF54CC5|nr:hypothetical protein [Pseudoalteromonas sp. MM17-2]MCG7543403.1 hypothetical protein [Pseudoalteromonas sp. MM17-2]